MPTADDPFSAQLPYYLTARQKDGLTSALRDFENSGKISNYYTNQYENEVLQGDGWPGLQLINFENGAKQSVKGIILSNSCDISPDNPRDLPRKIIFSPIIRMSRFEALLTQANVSTERLKEKIAAAKAQRVTSLFYLPKGGALEEDYLAVLQDIHTMPADVLDSASTNKLFTMSMVGFYLFIFKLSINFCKIPRRGRQVIIGASLSERAHSIVDACTVRPIMCQTLVEKYPGSIRAAAAGVVQW